MGVISPGLKQAVNYPLAFFPSGPPLLQQVGALGFIQEFCHISLAMRLHKLCTSKIRTNYASTSEHQWMPHPLFCQLTAFQGCQIYPLIS